MKNISYAFSSIFSDNEWFNKVLVGGLCFFLIPFFIGFILIFGFQVEFAKRILRGEQGMPMWREIQKIVKSGTKTGTAAFFYLGILLLVLFAIGINTISWKTFFVLSIAHFFWNPLLLAHFAKTESFISCFNPAKILKSSLLKLSNYLFAVAASGVLISVAFLLGWMWIVVGWTLLIFLAMLVQTHLFVDMNL